MPAGDVAAAELGVDVLSRSAAGGTGSRGAYLIGADFGLRGFSQPRTTATATRLNAKMRDIWMLVKVCT